MVYIYRVFYLYGDKLRGVKYTSSESKFAMESTYSVKNTMYSTLTEL